MSAGEVLSATELPWLRQPMASVRAALIGERAPHSLLLTGQPGAGLITVGNGCSLQSIGADGGLKYPRS